MGVSFGYASAAGIRADIAARHTGHGIDGIGVLTFGRPIEARHWLEASNPSERWKWDFMYQDLPPVKFAGMPAATSLLNALPLREVK